MRARHRHRKKLRVPEPLDVTIDRSGGATSPWSRPAIRERVWREAVGQRIADRARPLELTRDVLTVRVATSVWANELSLLSGELIERLRALGVPVKQMRFFVGPVERFKSPHEPRRRRVPVPAGELPPALDDAIQALDDDELREALGDAARANLAWQRNMPRRK